SYRWTLLADIPLCIMASAGIMRLLNSCRHLSIHGLNLRGPMISLFALAIVLFATLYIALPAQGAFPYYSSFPGLVPTSMIQDSVPQSDMNSVQMLLRWVSTHSQSADVLITHQAIYGWARAYLPAYRNIINYGYSSPLVGVEI